MSMMMKFASGTRLMDGTKSVTGGYGGVVYAGGEYTNEIPNTEPTDLRTTARPDGTYDKPYTNWKAKNYSAARTYNLGGASKIAATTCGYNEVTIKWHNPLVMLKMRKIAKRYGVFGVAPTAVNTKLWAA